MSRQEIEQRIEQLTRYIFRLPGTADLEFVSSLQSQLYALRTELAKQQLN